MLVTPDRFPSPREGKGSAMWEQGTLNCMATNSTPLNHGHPFPNKLFTVSRSLKLIVKSEAYPANIYPPTAGLFLLMNH